MVNCRAVKTGERCELNEDYEDFLFFINEEIKEQSRFIPETDFSVIERQSFASAVPEILEVLSTLKQIKSHRRK